MQLDKLYVFAVELGQLDDQKKMMNNIKPVALLKTSKWMQHDLCGFQASLITPSIWKYGTYHPWNWKISEIIKTTDYITSIP